MWLDEVYLVVLSDSGKILFCCVKNKLLAKVNKLSGSRRRFRRRGRRREHLYKRSNIVRDRRFCNFSYSLILLCVTTDFIMRAKRPTAPMISAPAKIIIPSVAILQNIIIICSGNPVPDIATMVDETKPSVPPKVRRIPKHAITARIPTNIKPIFGFNWSLTLSSKLEDLFAESSCALMDSWPWESCINFIFQSNISLMV